MKYVLYSLSIAYPVVLVSIGVIYGGLVFWTSFAASIVVIWIVLKRSGRGRTFATATFRFRTIVVTFGAFAMLALVFFGLLYTPLKILAIPIFGGTLAVAFLFGLRRSRSNSE